MGDMGRKTEILHDASDVVDKISKKRIKQLFIAKGGEQ
jgi:hypothetical protein